MRLPVPAPPLGYRTTRHVIREAATGGVDFKVQSCFCRNFPNISLSETESRPRARASSSLSPLFHSVHLHTRKPPPASSPACSSRAFSPCASDRISRSLAMRRSRFEFLRKLQVTSYKLQVTSYKVRVPAQGAADLSGPTRAAPPQQGGGLLPDFPKLQVTSYKLRVTFGKAEGLVRLPWLNARRGRGGAFGMT